MCPRVWLCVLWLYSHRFWTKEWILHCWPDQRMRERSLAERMKKKRSLSTVGPTNTIMIIIVTWQYCCSSLLRLRLLHLPLFEHDLNELRLNYIIFKFRTLLVFTIYLWYFPSLSSPCFLLFWTETCLGGSGAHWFFTIFWVLIKIFQF